MLRNRTSWCIALICATQLAAPMGLGQGQLRKAKVGDRMEAFSLTDTEGKSFSYPQGNGGRVLVMVFLSAHQTRSDRAVADLNQISMDLRQRGHSADLVAVISDSEDSAYFQALSKDLGLQMPVLVDREDRVSAHGRAAPPGHAFNRVI